MVYQPRWWGEESMAITLRYELMVACLDTGLHSKAAGEAIEDEPSGLERVVSGELATLGDRALAVTEVNHKLWAQRCLLESSSEI